MKSKPVEKALISIMKMHQETLCQTKDPWYLQERKQALRDSLEAFKQAGVIAGYNLNTGEILYAHKQGRSS